MAAKKNIAKVEPDESPKVEPSETVIIAGPLERGLEEAERILAADKANIVLDFKSCTFLSVDGLEWLEELLLRADSKKHDVTFRNVPPTIYKVFKVCHINSILKACGSPITSTGAHC